MVGKIKNYDILDLTKYIASLFIVAIHTSLFPSVLYPWLMIAVPIFFVISSFLLFKKISVSSENEKWHIIKSFIIRLIKYYIIWFIVCLPATIQLRSEWFSHGKIIGLLIAIRETLFSSTFKASWFIVALIWGALILGILCNKKNNWLVLMLTFVIYLAVCIRANYTFLIAENSTILPLIGLCHFFYG